MCSLREAALSEPTGRSGPTTNLSLSRGASVGSGRRSCVRRMARDWAQQWYKAIAGPFHANMLLGHPATWTSSLASGEHRLRSFGLGGAYGGAKVAPPATKGEPRPDPPLDTPVGTGRMDVHKDHPPCGVTGVSAIKQVTGSGFAPPTDPPSAPGPTVVTPTTGTLGENPQTSSTRMGGNSQSRRLPKHSPRPIGR